MISITPNPSPNIVGLEIPASGRVLGVAVGVAVAVAVGVGVAVWAKISGTLWKIKINANATKTINITLFRIEMVIPLR